MKRVFVVQSGDYWEHIEGIYSSKEKAECKVLAFLKERLEGEIRSLEKYVEAPPKWAQPWEEPQLRDKISNLKSLLANNDFSNIDFEVHIQEAVLDPEENFP